VSVKIGAVLMIIGTSTRLLINVNIYSLLVGFIICGIAKPFI